MKKLLGIFSTKTMTPEQIYEKTVKALEERQRLELIEMAKNRGRQKTKGK